MRPSYFCHQPPRQRGATLLVGMIMLLLMTLLAVGVFRISKVDLQMVANAQDRVQLLPATQAAIEAVISSTRFKTTPADALPQPCNGRPNTLCVDVNGDAQADISINVTASCVSTQVVSSPQLNFQDQDDRGCLVSAHQEFGVEGAANNNSLCANMLWDIQAQAQDITRAAAYAIQQGVVMRERATITCP